MRHYPASSSRVPYSVLPESPVKCTTHGDMSVENCQACRAYCDAMERIAEARQRRGDFADQQEPQLPSDCAHPVQADSGLLSRSLIAANATDGQPWKLNMDADHTPPIVAAVKGLVSREDQSSTFFEKVMIQRDAFFEALKSIATEDLGRLRWQIDRHCQNARNSFQWGGG